MGLEAALVDYIGGLVIPTLTICAFHLGFSLVLHIAARATSAMGKPVASPPLQNGPAPYLVGWTKGGVLFNNC